jgi:hypothetical protein
LGLDEREWDGGVGGHVEGEMVVIRMSIVGEREMGGMGRAEGFNTHVSRVQTSLVALLLLL